VAGGPRRVSYFCFTFIIRRAVKDLRHNLGGKLLREKEKDRERRTLRRPAIPPGLCPFVPLSPALKRWAKVGPPLWGWDSRAAARQSDSGVNFVIEAKAGLTNGFGSCGVSPQGLKEFAENVS